MKEGASDTKAPPARTIVQRAAPPAKPIDGNAAGIPRALEAELESLKLGAVEAVGSILAERLDAIVENKVKKVLSSSMFIATQKMKDAIMKAIQGVLVDSGLLEKFVDRAVEQKLKEARPQSGSSVALKAAAGGTIDAQALKAEVQSIVHKEIAAQTSSEAMKEMIDEKFRAISLYLKSDVIPKAVAQALKPKPA